MFGFGILSPELTFNNFDYSWYVYVLLLITGIMILFARILSKKFFSIFVGFIFLSSTYLLYKYDVTIKEHVKIPVLGITNLGFIRGLFGMSLGMIMAPFINKYVKNASKKHFYLTSIFEYGAFVALFCILFSKPDLHLKWIVSFLCCVCLIFAVYSNGIITSFLNKIQYNGLSTLSYHTYIL